MPILPSFNTIQTVSDVGTKQLDVSADAIQSLIDLGLPIPTKPSTEFIGAIPHKIADLDDDELGNLLQEFVNWTGYLNYELSKVETELEVSKSQYEFIQASVRIALRSSEGRMTVQDKTDAMRTDKRVLEYQSKYLFNYTRYNILKAMRDMAQGSWDTVSRRITQRTSDKDRSKRVENVTMSNPLKNPFRRG